MGFTLAGLLLLALVAVAAGVLLLGESLTANRVLGGVVILPRV